MLGSPPTLEQALELAKSTKAFRIRGDGKRLMVSYIYHDPAVFSTPWVRDLRGIVYSSEDGRVLSRPFHKFYNYSEPPFGMRRENFPKVVHVAEKIDGYLLQAFLDDGEVRLASRRSLNPSLIGPIVEELWDEDHRRAAMEFLSGGTFTLLFEVFSPHLPVMVKYDEPGIRLLAVRDIASGRYLLPGVHFSWPLPHVSWSEVRDFDPDALIRKVSDSWGVEGYVVFVQEANEFSKFKSGWAFRVSGFLMDPYASFLVAYLEGRVDDLVASLLGRDDLQERVLVATEYLDNLYRAACSVGERLRSEGATGKDAWDSVRQEAESRFGVLAPLFSRVAMAAYRGQDPWEAFISEMSKGKYSRLVESLNFFSREVGDVGE